MGHASIIRIAAGAFLGILLVACVLVVMTPLRVEDLGPVLVYDASLVSVLLLLFAPTQGAR